MIMSRSPIRISIEIDLFPDHWKDFEREGVNGAIDFVSLSRVWDRARAGKKVTTRVIEASCAR